MLLWENNQWQDSVKQICCYHFNLKLYQKTLFIQYSDVSIQYIIDTAEISMTSISAFIFHFQIVKTFTIVIKLQWANLNTAIMQYLYTIKSIH